MRISNPKVRRRLIKYAKLFLQQNCQYDDGRENAGVEVMLQRLSPADPARERLNKKLLHAKIND